jgi:septum formation protein
MGVWLAPQPLILASKSSARRAMLEAAAIPVEVHPAGIDEREVEASLASPAPSEVAARLAAEKAREVAAAHPGRLVVAADQTLAVGSRRFTKPADRAAAREQLAALRGRNHALYSAVAVVRGGALLYQHDEMATLAMRDFSDQFLETYLDQAGAQATASVGGYQLERLGVHLFDRVEGDFFTILGLPLLPLLSFLRREGSLA